MSSSPLSFKMIAVQRLNNGEPLALVSRSLGIPTQTLSQWALVYRDRTPPPREKSLPGNVGHDGVVRDRCPHCGSKWRKQSHATPDPLEVDVYLQCTNILCSFAALGVMTILNELTPSKMANSAISERTPPLGASLVQRCRATPGIEGHFGDI